MASVRSRALVERRYEPDRQRARTLRPRVADRVERLTVRGRRVRTIGVSDVGSAGEGTAVTVDLCVGGAVLGAQRVISVLTLERVRSRAAVERVVLIIAIERVVARPALEV